MDESLEGFLADARAEAGLDDFGSRHFEPVVAAWAEDLTQDRLSPRGRAVLRRQMVRNLVLRLRVIDTLKRHPEIDAVRLPRIVLITGHARSGTTLLHNLLALAHGTRAMLRWELVQPLPPPEAASYETDPRIAKVQAVHESLRGTPIEQMHWVAATDPEECPHGFFDGSGLIGGGISGLMRAWSDARLRVDHRLVFGEYRRLLQLLLWKNPPPDDAVLLLKSPVANTHLDAFENVFPGTHYLLTPRDVARTVISMAAIMDAVGAPMLADGHSLRESEAAEPLALPMQLRAIDQMLWLADRNPERVTVVRYPDLMADPVGCAQRALRDAGIPADEQLSAKVAGFLAEQRAGRRARPPAGYDSYGYDPDVIRRHPAVRRFMDRFELAPELDRLTETAV